MFALPSADLLLNGKEYKSTIRTKERAEFFAWLIFSSAPFLFQLS